MIATRRQRCCRFMGVTHRSNETGGRDDNKESRPTPLMSVIGKTMHEGRERRGVLMKSRLIACAITAMAACASEVPLAISPVPPGVVSAWRTAAGSPDTVGTGAAIHRARDRVRAGASRGARLVAVELRASAQREEAVANQTAAVAPEDARPEGSRPRATRRSASADPRRSASADTPASPPVDPHRSSPDPTRRIDPNRASPAELEALPGIGPVLAGRLVDGRPYRSDRDLLRVSGIGPATLRRLRPYITLDESTIRR